MADLNLEGAQQTAIEARKVATNPQFDVHAVQVDVAIEESMKAAIEYAVKAFGRIDYGVHSAGVSLASRSSSCSFSVLEMSLTLESSLDTGGHF